MPDRKSICPNRPRRKVPMSRPSQTESAYVQAIVRSKFFVFSSCAEKSPCPAFKIPMSSVQNPHVRAFKIFRGVLIVRSKIPMSRLSCVQNCRCPDYRAFKIAHIQNIVRSFFPKPCNFERTTPPGAFILVWTYRLSVWHLNLGSKWLLYLKRDQLSHSYIESKC